MENKTNIYIDYENKKISLEDLTDQWNLPRGYSRKVRGFKKVVQYARENLPRLQQMTMYSVISELDTVADLGFRTYCAMD